MSVECVLKLLDLIEPNNFPFQSDNNKCDKPSDWIDNLIIDNAHGKRALFIRRFETDRRTNFSDETFEKLFATIDYELSNDRFVIICLKSDKSQPYHMHIIYHELGNGHYNTFTFVPNSKIIKEVKNLRDIVNKMDGRGTPIYTYS